MPLIKIPTQHITRMTLLRNHHPLQILSLFDQPLTASGRLTLTLVDRQPHLCCRPLVIESTYIGLLTGLTTPARAMMSLTMVSV